MLKKLIARTFVGKYLSLAKALAADKRVPLVPRLLFWLAVVYLVVPFDFMTDWIPFLGQFDDLIVTVTLLTVASKFVPREIYEEQKSRHVR
jgi:uncharacterized membrane protein YkvA (DUF1232 family)